MSKLFLLPNDEYGMGVYESKDIIATSRGVAEMFGKRHDNVLRDIETIMEDLGNLKNEGSYFYQSKYKTEQNKLVKEYLMTRDGFTLLAMGFTGKRALQFKIAYINRFNEMERALDSRHQARLEIKAMTDGVKQLHNPPKPYHYSNELDMINRIVLGMSAKEFKIANGIPNDVTSIRPYMSQEQITLLQQLQMVNGYLLTTTPNYQDRKKALEEYAKQLRVRHVVKVG